MAKKINMNRKSVKRPKLESIEDSLYKQSVETKPAPKVETKPVPKVETKPAPKVKTKPVPKVETKPVSKAVTNDRKGATGYRENVERTMISLDASDLEYIKSYAWENGLTVNGAIRDIVHQWSKKKSIKSKLPNIRDEWNKAGKPKPTSRAVFVSKAIEY